MEDTHAGIENLKRAVADIRERHAWQANNMADDDS